MNRYIQTRNCNILAAGFAVAMFATGALADEFYWNNGDGFGGVFGDGYYWDRPSDPYVPGEDDTAIFDVAGVFAVNFEQAHTIDRLIVRHGRVSFTFSPYGQAKKLIAQNANPGTPGVVIGREDGDVACLQISADMDVVSPSFSLGQSPDSLGILRLTADDARIDYEESFRIGDAGVGFMHVGNAEIFMHNNVPSAEFDIGSQPGSFGRLVVEGPSVYWRPTGVFAITSIGRAGTGELLVADGAEFYCYNGIIGGDRGSIGAVTVDGAKFGASGDRLEVGSLGIGSLDVINGGKAHGGITTIGTYRVEPPDYAYGEGGVGRVTATGEGSDFSASDLYIGYESVGTLKVADLAIAEASGSVTIAYLSAPHSWDSKGTLVCSQGGTFVIEGDLIHGAGEADIVIELAAGDDYLNPAINVIGGVDGFDAEVVLLNDFIPQAGDLFYVAHADGGISEFVFTLPDLPPPLEWEVVQDGYDVSLAVFEDPLAGGVIDAGPFPGLGYAGYAARPLGFAAEFYWNNARYRGQFDDPSFWNDGASGVPSGDDEAIFDAAGIFDVDFVVPGVTDRLIVRHGMLGFHLSPEAGYNLLNTLPITPGIVVGDGEGDAARLTVEGGALQGVFTDLAFQHDAVGYLTVEGPDTSLTNEQHLHIGNGGAGIFEASGGAAVSNLDGMIAAAGGAYGKATYTGPGTTWTCDGALAVGKNGFGEMVISDGATVTCMDATIAQYLGSMGSVTVTGNGSNWLIDGTLDVGMVGFGSMLIEDGGSVWNHTFAIIGTYPNMDWIIPGEGGDGNVTVTGDGSIWTIDGDLHIGLMAWWAYLTIADEGAVEVAGSLYHGSATYSTLALLRGGTIMVGGDFETGDWGEFHIELGENDYVSPAINVMGSMNESSAQITLADGFTPGWDDVFHIVHAGAGVEDFGFTLPDPPPHLEWEVFNDGYDVKLLLVSTLYGDVNGDTVVDIDDVFAVLAAWGECDGCPEDLNEDGFVDIDDLFIVLANWT